MPCIISVNYTCSEKGVMNAPMIKRILNKFYPGFFFHSDLITIKFSKLFSSVFTRFSKIAGSLWLLPVKIEMHSKQMHLRGLNWQVFKDETLGLWSIYPI